MAITKKQREEVERLIYTNLDLIDRSKTNTEYYKKKFSKMSDSEFEALFHKEFPLLFHHKPWVVEPTMADIKDALDSIGVPMCEKVELPHIHESKDGEAMTSKETMVFYIHHKKMQQFIAKKNSMSTSIETRDMRTGLLIDHDKNGKTSDREMESFVNMECPNAMLEFNTIKADFMDAKSEAYNEINTTGKLFLKDIHQSNRDSLSKNMMNVYMLGGMIQSNIINVDYYLPYTLERTQNTIKRS